jgi:hypothetical protein
MAQRLDSEAHHPNTDDEPENRLEDTGVDTPHMLVAEFKDFNQQFDFLKSKPPMDGMS